MRDDDHEEMQAPRPTLTGSTQGCVRSMMPGSWRQLSSRVDDSSWSTTPMTAQASS